MSFMLFVSGNPILYEYMNNLNTYYPISMMLSYLPESKYKTITPKSIEQHAFERAYKYPNLVRFDFIR